MAVGDAMGTAVKSLKPETIRQYFGEVDGYKDVRPYIGQGIKQYRMQGLYSCHMQSALAVGDCLLKNKRAGVTDFAAALLQLGTEGPENHFGVYRHPEGLFRKAVEMLNVRDPRLPSDQNTNTGCFPIMSIPLALYHQKESDELTRLCLETSLMMSRNVWEAAGSALAAFTVLRLLQEEPEEGENPLPRKADAWLEETTQYCRKVESTLQSSFPEVWGSVAEGGGFSRTLEGLRARLNKGFDELMEWICHNASEHVKIPVHYATQGYVLTLIPLAFVLLLKQAGDFRSLLTTALNMGRESDKLGGLMGAWAGALFGFSGIPENWKAGLVNAREIKARGEYLALQTPPKGLKDLHLLEQGATLKKMEDERRYVPRKAKKPVMREAFANDPWSDGDEEAPLPPKDDIAELRKFQRDKSRKKRDRRKNMDWSDD